MNATSQLHDVAQRLWLDSITRELMTSGRLSPSIDDLSVMVLTFNAAILPQAIGQTDAGDVALPPRARAGPTPLAVFNDLMSQVAAPSAASVAR